jgi:hypothetical protein
MDRRLSRLVENVKSMTAQEERVDGLGAAPVVDTSYALQRQIVDSGLVDTFKERDLVEAALEVGIPETDVPQFIEELASWM